MEKDAKINFQKKHLDNAIYIDLNTQLSNIKEDLSKGGRHPLPEINSFLKMLAAFGISPDKHVVVYDDKNGANAAARFWWMLKSIGHDRVQVLNGGIQAAEKINFPTNSTSTSCEHTPISKYNIKTWGLPLVNIDEVQKVSQNENYIVIDVRDRERFCGETENIDLVAGRIPGAINIPFTTNLDENGFFLTANELKRCYKKNIQ